MRTTTHTLFFSLLLSCATPLFSADPVDPHTDDPATNTDLAHRYAHTPYNISQEKLSTALTLFAVAAVSVLAADIHTQPVITSVQTIPLSAIPKTPIDFEFCSTNMPFETMSAIKNGYHETDCCKYHIECPEGQTEINSKCNAKKECVADFGPGIISRLVERLFGKKEEPAFNELIDSFNQEENK